MSVINQNLLLTPEGYQISRSVRLRSSASAYFNRTPASTTNQKTLTWSGWVKRGELGTIQVLFGTADSTGAGYNTSAFSFVASTNNLRFVTTNNIGASLLQFDTTAVFRDPSAWYHIVLYVDTTQATNTNGIRIYVNGVNQAGTHAAYTQNTNTFYNSTIAQYIGRYSSISPAAYFDGYLTEVNFIDGQALTPSSFGQTNTITGVWQPIKYTGTYGTNGFYLNFSDNSNNTATTIGKDYSGNGNNWTPNNISVTAGVTYDSMLDVPTLFADGGNGRGNYAVLNPLDVRSNSGTGTLTNGNLSAAATGTTNGSGPTRGSTQYITSDNYYFEVTVLVTSGTSYSLIGVRQDGSGTYGADYCWLQVAGSTNSGIIVTAAGNVQTSLGFVSANDVIGVAVESAGFVTFYRNNTVVGTRQSFAASAGLQPFVEPRVGGGGANLASFAANFGQRPFAYTPPTGFVALNTQNLPTPTISNGANYMAATTYTGNGTTQSITNTINGISFQPDFVWFKGRSAATGNGLYDSIRGVLKNLSSESTAAESTVAGTVTAFNSNGFSVGNQAATNTNGATYIGWQWKAGTTSSSNTNGSITSTVSVGATQGFSVVTFTEPASGSYTFGHGLGVTPSMFIVKERNNVTNWVVWHNYWQSVDPIPTKKGQYLNSTLASFTTGSDWLNSLSSTTIGITTGQVTSGGSTMVAYCFSEVAGYSKFGSYTGNGSTDGPFVFCGFRPRWIMIKQSDAVRGWNIEDTSRSTYNSMILNLDPGSSAAENSNAAWSVDAVSNGFKIRTTDTSFNASSGTYIFAAFAENPFKNSLAR